MHISWCNLGAVGCCRVGPPTVPIFLLSARLRILSSLPPPRSVSMHCQPLRAAGVHIQVHSAPRRNYYRFSPCGVRFPGVLSPPSSTLPPSPLQQLVFSTHPLSARSAVRRVLTTFGAHTAAAELRRLRRKTVTSLVGVWPRGLLLPRFLCWFLC